MCRRSHQVRRLSLGLRTLPLVRVGDMAHITLDRVNEKSDTGHTRLLTRSQPLCLTLARGSERQETKFVAHGLARP